MAATEEPIVPHQRGGQSHVVLEFFSGIGGMRYAVEAWVELASDSTSPRTVRVAASFEISEVCNRVYAHNFGDNPRTKSIEHLDTALLDSFGADTWLMSPPCQPYTSMGKQRDAQDPRARALLHLCDVIPKLSAPPSYILLENVNHFQHSQSHGLWLEAMKSAGFLCHEFLLSPAQIGIPNERLRYYCLARRLSPNTTGPWTDTSFCGQLLNHVPGDDAVRPGVHDGFENDESDEHDGLHGREGEETQVDEGRENNEAPNEVKDEVDSMAGVQAGELGPKKKRGGHGLIYVDLNATRAALYSHCRPIEEFLEERGSGTNATDVGNAQEDRQAADGDGQEEDPFAEYKIPDADLMKWKGYVFDIVTPGSKR